LSAKQARSDYAKLSALSYLGNAETLADLTYYGVCHKYPNLKFVLVESGFGWLPYFIEALDWQWSNSGAAKAYPDMEVPSFYFRRQVYGSFWFEKDTVSRMLDLYADNITFESDYPHPTSLSPGPASSAKTPRETILESMADLPDDVCRKVLQDNAAELYHLTID
jgi:predicted TIM-barrel fold metal-dependent hydrolase